MLTLERGHSFYPLLMSMSDAFSIFYTLIKLHYTKALSNQASSLAPDWILLLQRRIPASESSLVQQQPFNNTFSMHCYYCLVTKVCLIPLWPYGLWSARLLCHGISQVRRRSGFPVPSPGDLPNPGLEPMSPALGGKSFTTESPVKPNEVLAYICKNGHNPKYWLSSSKAVEQLSFIADDNQNSKMVLRRQFYTILFKTTIKKIYYLKILLSYNPTIALQGNKNLCPHKNLHVHVYCSFIHNCQNLGTTKLSFGRWMYKQTVVLTDNR